VRNVQEAVDVLVASRSLILATDVENDNYIARRCYCVRSEPEREHSVDHAAFEVGSRGAEEVILSHPPALSCAVGGAVGDVNDK
jgi:hypothetical protein